MEGRDEEPPPIEVELTAHESSPRRGWRRRRAADVPSDSPGGVVVDPATPTPIPTNDGASGGEGRTGSLDDRDPLPRIVAIGAAAAVVGLAAGWMLGAGIGGSDAEPIAADLATSTSVDDSSDESADESELDDETFDDLEPIDTVRPTTTTRPPRTTTTTTEPEAMPIELHPAIAGTGAQLVGLDGQSRLVEIDAARGLMTTTRLTGGLMDAFNMRVGPDWIATVYPSSGRTRLITADGQVDDPALGDFWSLLPIPGTNRFWRFDQSNGPPSGPTEYVQVDLTGEETGPVITSPGGWPFGVDPAGGILHVTQGKSFSVDADGVELVGDGELLGITADVAVLRSCDERLECALTVVDRATGVARIVAVRDEFVQAESYYFRGTAATPLAPDGSAIAMTVFGDRGPELFLVDLATGDDVELDTLIGTQSATWTADSRALVFIGAAGAPVVFDRTTRTVEPLADGLTNWNLIDIRPQRVPDPS